MTMDISSNVASWLSFTVTALGLGGLISQASAINEKLDPFHANRTAEYLGIWFQRQAQFPWWRIAKPPPEGPLISAKLSEGFCGHNNLQLTRVPLPHAGKAGWTVILSIFHIELPYVRHKIDSPLAEKGLSSALDIPESAHANAATPSDSHGWTFLAHGPLIRHQTSACIAISRTTLITMLAITNARVGFLYTDASGYRANYASYNGQWYITWPIGQEAIVKFSPHDSHSAGTDAYPPCFPQRVDRCVQMLAGVISARHINLKVAFCGRKPPGSYILEYVAKGFPGAHGSRHLYNMMGGKVYEIDFMSARPLDLQAPSSLALDLPSTEKGRGVTMFIPKTEEEVIKCALDSLPWNSLSWSIHRGMCDILKAYAQPVMNRYRKRLAAMLKQTVVDKPHLLESRGWNSQFVSQNMGDMASSAILAGVGNSGDLVRVVTDVVLVLTGEANWDIDQLDETNFWRQQQQQQQQRQRPSPPTSSSSSDETSDEELSLSAVVALTKVFVLEWSNEFDYQMYHNLPISLYFG